MSVLEEINNLLPDNNTRAIEPKHVREALGKVLGSLPTNIAKIDEGEGDNKKNGNTYTKDQVNTELGKKLSKPTTTISSPTAVVKYVILVDEQGNTQRMLAEDLGKNIGNSDLIIPPDTVRILDITGAKLQTKGLENKKNDASFDSKLILNANGEWAVSDEPDVRFNLPDRVNFTAPPTTLNVTITNVAPSTITVAGNPNFAEEIQELMSNLTKIDWIDFTAEDYGSPLLENGMPKYKLDNRGFITPYEDLLSKKTFPFEKDFILKIELYNSISDYISIGLYRELSTYSDYNGAQSGNQVVFFIKKANILYRCIYGKEGRWGTQLMPIQEQLGYIGIALKRAKQKISYKILN